MRPRLARQSRHPSRPRASTPPARAQRGPLTGDIIDVFWPDDNKWYRGKLSRFFRMTGHFIVTYVDDEVERLALEKEKWRYVGHPNPNPPPHARGPDRPGPCKTSLADFDSDSGFTTSAPPPPSRVSRHRPDTPRESGSEAPVVNKGAPKRVSRHSPDLPRDDESEPDVSRVVDKGVSRHISRLISSDDDSVDSSPVKRTAVPPHARVRRADLSESSDDSGEDSTESVRINRGRGGNRTAVRERKRLVDDESSGSDSSRATVRTASHTSSIGVARQKRRVAGTASKSAVARDHMIPRGNIPPTPPRTPPPLAKPRRMQRSPLPRPRRKQVARSPSPLPKPRRKQVASSRSPSPLPKPRRKQASRSRTPPAGVRRKKHTGVVSDQTRPRVGRSADATGRASERASPANRLKHRANSSSATGSSSSRKSVAMTQSHSARTSFARPSGASRSSSSRKTATTASGSSARVLSTRSSGVARSTSDQRISSASQQRAPSSTPSRRPMVTADQVLGNRASNSQTTERRVLAMPEGSAPPQRRSGSAPKRKRSPAPSRNKPGSETANKMAKVESDSSPTSLRALSKRPAQDDTSKGQKRRRTAASTRVSDKTRPNVRRTPSPTWASRH